MFKLGDVTNRIPCLLQTDYNMAVLRWMVHFPRQLLVPITESAVTGSPHCMTDPSIFGESLPLHAVVSDLWSFSLWSLISLETNPAFLQLADQQSALFGCGGLRRGDTTISMGTGIFIQKNLEDKPHASMKGKFLLYLVDRLSSDDVICCRTLSSRSMESRWKDDIPRRGTTTSISCMHRVSSRVDYGRMWSWKNWSDPLQMGEGARLLLWCRSDFLHCLFSLRQ